MSLQADIAVALARNTHDIKTNTPLEVLADHLIASLRNFEASLIERSAHPFYAPGRERIVRGEQ